MAIRLQTEGAYNLHGEFFNMYLEDADYGGDPIDVEGSNQGFTLRYDGKPETRLDPIIGSEARYYIRVTPETLADIEAVAADLITSAENRFFLRITRNSGAPLASDELYWCGYVLTDLSAFSDENRFEFVFTATDGLARLKSIEYKDTTGLNYAPFGNLTFIEHIMNCLTQDGLSSTYWSGSDVFLKTVVNWQDENMATPTAAKCPLAYTRVQGFVFAKPVESDDADYIWEYLSCYDVLVKICEHWAARLMFSFGCYRFEQVNERSQDNFFERRFSNAGALVSSTAIAGYDKNVNQDTAGARLAGGLFSYLAPLKQVVVEYEHNTFRNYLSGNANYWYLGSVLGATGVTLTPISVDGDTFFRISGSAYINVDLIADYTDIGWWRYVLGMQVFIGGQAIKSHTLAATGPGGNLIPVVIRDPILPTWVSGADNYEISTSYAYDGHIEEMVTFSFDTPVVPSGTSIFISFTALGGRRLDETSEPVTLNDWRIQSPVFGIINSSSIYTFFEKVRRYTVTNTNTGNSREYKYNTIFGEAIKGWTDSKLQTSSDGSTWADSTASWDYGAGTEDLAFGSLLASEIMAGQIFPPRVYSGQIWANQTYAHSRIVLPDDTAYLILSGEYRGKDGAWSGEWFEAGVDLASVVIGPSVPIGNTGTSDDPPGFTVVPTGAVNTATGQQSASVGDAIGLNVLAINYIGDTVTSGTITTIPLTYAAADNSIFAGDTLNIYNPTTGEIIAVEVDADVNGGDTTISIVSTSVTNDILLGSYIFLGNVNHYTGEGSGAGTGFPAGTDTQTIRYNGTVATANSALRNDGTYISINQAPDTNRILIVKQPAATKGLAVVRDANTDQVHIYHNGTATIESVGGNSLALKTASGSLINLIAGGGGGQLSQVQIAPGANMTANLGNAGMFVLFGTYAPTSSGGDFSLIRLGTAINQSGSADQVVAGLKIVPTLTAVAAAFYGVWYEPSTQTFLWQPNGTGVKSHLLGNLGIGTGTTSPGAKLDVVGNGTTSGTYTAKFYDGNGTPAVIMVVRDDQRVGIRTASPSAPLHVVGAGTSSAANALLVEDSSNAETFKVRNDGVAIAGGYAAQSNAPTISFAGGAGTGPTNDFCVGSANGFYLIFTTGTSPGTNTSIFTATIGESFPNGVIATFSPGNANILTPFPTLYISGTGGNSVTLSTTGTLAASTTYGIFFTIMGY